MLSRGPVLPTLSAVPAFSARACLVFAKVVAKGFDGGGLAAPSARASPHPSIFLDEAGFACGFECFAQLVRIALHAERANLRGVEDAPFA